MYKVSDYAAISSIYFDELNSECIAKSFEMCLDDVESEVVSAKPVKIFVPEFFLVVKLQVFTCKLSNMPLFAKR